MISSKNKLSKIVQGMHVDFYDICETCYIVYCRLELWDGLVLGSLP